MRAQSATDIALVAGGVIPDEDVPGLRALGVADVVLQDTAPDEVVARVRGAATRLHGQP
jgi:methylmalonyl-CoA mutase C-terminal domain/subunit